MNVSFKRARQKAENVSALRYLSLKEKNIDDDRQNDPINSKWCKFNAVDQLQKESYGQKRENKRTDESGDNKRQDVDREMLPIFNKRKTARPRHYRHSHNKRNI